MDRGNLPSAQSPENPRDLAGILFDDLVTQIGTSAIGQLIENFEKSVVEGKSGVTVAFPEVEETHVISIADDVVHVHYGGIYKPEDFILPLKDVKERIKKIAQAQADSNAAQESNT